MKADTLRELIEVNPFKSFSINLADAMALKVPHRDFMSISLGARMLTVWDQNATANLIDLMRVIGFHVKGRSSGRTKTSK